MFFFNVGLQVALSSPQLSWLTVEQASAVTEEQWSELGGEQKRALAMALYEGDLPLEHRGKHLSGAWMTQCVSVKVTKCSLIVKSLTVLLYVGHGDFLRWRS